MEVSVWLGCADSGEAEEEKVGEDAPGFLNYVCVSPQTLTDRPRGYQL
jgi:hypothetical protein